ncbi:MAG: hypothetical protein R3C30_03055 [Hyphomonadaceae bacterium]
MVNKPLAALIAVAALSLASLAQAQSANFQAAQAMIERTQLNGVFEPLEDDSVIKVRHAASGMACLFGADDRRAEIVAFASPVPRGDDVGCVSDTTDHFTTVYATRYPEPKSPEQALAEAVACLRHRYPDAQATPTLLSVTSDSLAPIHAAHFLITVDDQRWITSALVAEHDGWIFKVRYTAAAADDDALSRHQLEANLRLTYALLSTARE